MPQIPGPPHLPGCEICWLRHDSECCRLFEQEPGPSQAPGVGVIPPPWASTVIDPCPWALHPGGQTTPFPAIFAGPGGPALSQRMRAGLKQAGLSASLLGVIGPTALVVAQSLQHTSPLLPRNRSLTTGPRIVLVLWLVIL